MTAGPPLVVLVGGPNGAGKSTSAPSLLRGALAVEEFVNADTIARGLSEFHPESVAVAAGRMMIERLRLLAAERRSFAFETTLAGRGHCHWVRKLRASGYISHLVFLSLPDPELAVARVAARVQEGGHDIPSEVVHRRFVAGLRNLISLYAREVDGVQIFENADLDGPRLIASKRPPEPFQVFDAAAWQSLMEYTS